MAYQYLLNFQIRGQASPVEFEVRESHWFRAQGLFDHDASFYRPKRFLTFDTVDGLVVAVGYSDVQFVRFLYNILELPTDQKHKDDDIQIWLREHEEPMAIRVGDEKDALSAFFIALDTGAEFDQFPALIDEDGEMVRFNVYDLVLVTAPLHEVSEGHRELLKDDDFDGLSDLPEIPF